MQSANVIIFERNLRGHRLAAARYLSSALPQATIVAIDAKASSELYDVVITKGSLKAIRYLFTKSLLWINSADDKFFTYLLVATLRSLLGYPTTLNYYQAHLFTNTRRLKGLIKHLYFQMHRSISKKNTHIFYANDHLKRYFLHYRNCSFLPDSQMFDIPEDVTRSNMHLSNPSTIFLLIGELTPRKGLGIALSAFHKLAKARESDFILRLVGRIEGLSDVDETYISELLKRKVIEIVDRSVSEEEFYTHMQESDFILLPYDKSFNGPSGIFGRAIQLNKRIIATNHGWIGTTASKYKIGETFDSEDVEAFVALLSRSIDNPTPINNKGYQKLRTEYSPSSYNYAVEEAINRLTRPSSQH